MEGIVQIQQRWAPRLGRWLLAAVALLMIGGCSDPSGSDAALPTPSPDERWYSQAQVDQGEAIYQQYCVECHNARARGTRTWKERNAEGHLPPPPLDGTAHAWHHPLPALMQTISQGGQPYGGQMPGFEDRLDQSQMLAVIAYFQHFWPDRIYQRWAGAHR